MEPFFIAQTFEQDTVQNEQNARRWFADRSKEASREGGSWPRYTISDDGKGLLFECWQERPDQEGGPRWQMRYKNKQGGQG